MANSNLSIPASAINRLITVNVMVTGMRTWRMRWALARFCLRLAAWIAGCNLTVDVRERPRSQRPEWGKG